MISCFRTEKNHQDKLNGNEDDEDMEKPFPTEIRNDWTCNDGRPKIRMRICLRLHVGNCAGDKVEERDA